MAKQKNLTQRVEILEERMYKRNRENDVFTASIDTLNKNVKKVDDSVQLVHTRLDQGDIAITIKNGELPARYNLQEFLQSLKDAPMNAVTGTGKLARNINEVIKSIGSFIAIVYVLFQLIVTYIKTP